MCHRIVTCLLVMLPLAGAALATNVGAMAAAVSNATGTPAAPAPAAGACRHVATVATAAPASAPTLAGVTVLRSSADLRKARDLHLRDHIEVRLTNPLELVGCLADSRTDPVLFIDHLPLADLKPRGKVLRPDGSLVLTYRLESTAGTRAAWDELRLRNWLDDHRPRAARLGIGSNALFELALLDTPDFVVRVGAGNPSWGVLALVLAAVAFLLLATESRVLRDRQPQGAIGASGQQSFSLARAVLVAWILTTTACIGLVFLDTGAVPALDGGMPLLMLASGITAGTGAAVDFIRNIGFGRSESFLVDLVTDAEGLAMHRLQALGVNLLILGVVWWELIAFGTIAHLDRGWGLLMGVSTGIYLYGKASEPTL